MNPKNTEKFPVIEDVQKSYYKLPPEKQEYIRGLMQGILISRQSYPRKRSLDKENVA